MSVQAPEPAASAESETPLIPARMVNEYVYCPRLAYLEWVQGEWAESVDTVEGRFNHRRVNRKGGALPEPGAISGAISGDVTGETRIHARSITLSSDALGAIAVIDLLEGEGGCVSPVDYKHGKRPHVEKGAYDPERVQLCIQGLLLEEHGYQCGSGVIYYVASRERVNIDFDAELRAMTNSALEGIRRMADGGGIPEPLEDSPRCPHCSLVGICLPDELNFIRFDKGEVRPLAVSRDESLPLYVQAARASIRKNGDTLEVWVDDAKETTARINDISQLAIMGNASVTAPALHELMRRGIPVSWHSLGGWFMGHTTGLGHKNVELRAAQYRASFNDAACLQIACGLIQAKIRNCRTLARRNWRDNGRDETCPDETLAEFRHGIDEAGRAKGIPELMGVEGQAAARYFGIFGGLLKRDDNNAGNGNGGFSFDFNERNRRPPKDPVNALLSFAYTLLARSWHVTLSAVGFDPYRGFYHQPRYGRPALALDMMEPFRPLVADSSVLTAINNGEVEPDDFVSAAGGVALKDTARKRFIATFERRLDQEITHPIFGYKVSYRRLFEVQARLLGRFLMGEINDYPNFVTR
ncbi:MAG: CRISPR-associated endonuclease Cas1 [Nitrospirae bacterium]|nr:CRISPR-associated endonuclease Cas1 [Nitrospirota bacterium]